MDRLLSVTEYANKYHKDPGNIRRLLAAGRLEGTKIGNQWVIPVNAVYPEDKRQTSGKYRNWRKRILFNSNHIIKSEIESMISDLLEIYHNKIDRFVLYGSYARGEQTPESDVDIAMIMKTPATRSENKAMYSCVASHELNCGTVLSVIDINEQDYSDRVKYIPFYKNIEKEGIVLWKAQ